MSKRVSFMKHLDSCIGRADKLSDFPLNDLTPEFEYYADGIEDGFEGNPDEIKEAPPPTSEASDNYVGSRLQLPCGQILARVRVLKRARDNDDMSSVAPTKTPFLTPEGMLLNLRMMSR